MQQPVALQPSSSERSPSVASEHLWYLPSLCSPRSFLEWNMDKVICHVIFENVFSTHWIPPRDDSMYEAIMNKVPIVFHEQPCDLGCVFSSLSQWILRSSMTSQNVSMCWICYEMDKQLLKMVYSFRLYLNSFASTVIVLDTLKQWFVCMGFSMLLSIVSIHVIPLGCRILKECWFASVMAWDIEYTVLNLFSVYSFFCKIFVCNLIFSLIFSSFIELIDFLYLFIFG